MSAKKKRPYTMTEEERERRRKLARELHTAGKLRRKGPMPEEERKLHAKILQRPESRANRLKAQRTPEYKARLAQRAHRGCADGTFRRKTPPSAQERKANSERMKAKNPVKSKEVRNKISQSLRKRSKELSERLHQRWESGEMKPHPQTEAQRRAASERMKANNPMKNPAVAAKVAESKRKAWTENHKEMAEQWIRAGTPPNKAEQTLAELIAPLNFRFVGGGDFWIGPCQSGMCRNPDFVYKTGRLKIAILLNGEYWHSRPERNDQQEVADYHGMGWRILIISDTELRDAVAVVTKVRNWMDGLKSLK